MPTVSLNDGTTRPVLGYGTYKVGVVPASASSQQGVADASTGDASLAMRPVLDALAVGYRCLDCAEFYENESFVGEALAASGVPRGELYLSSKVWTTTMERGADAVAAQVRRTLEQLGTSFLDCVMVHWPVPGKHVDAYVALEECVAMGLVNSVGVSNYTVEDLVELMDDPRVQRAPAVNQIEVNPCLWRPETVRFCQSRNILVEAYRPLNQGGRGGMFATQAFVDVCAKHGATPAQVSLRFALDHGCAVTVKTMSRARMKENLGALQFKLDDDDLRRLATLTTQDALDAFASLYRKCVTRDTHVPPECARETFTVG